LNNALTKSTSYYVRKLSKYSAFLLVVGTSFLFTPIANATAPELMVRDVTIICANPAGETHTALTGWNADNTFFEGKGDIAKLFCEGGFIGEWTTYISDNYSGVGRYYNGIAPTTSVNPTPTPQDTSTSTSETQTPLVEETVTSVVPSDTPTVVVDSPTVETLTPVVSSDTQTSNVEPSETQTVPSESSTQTIPTETTTPITETPLPIPVPVPVVVQPEPARPIESQAPEIQPEPQPQPEPEPEPEPIPEEPPLEEAEPEPAPPAPEEQPPDEPPSERPIEEDTNEIPSEPEIEPPSEPEPAPEPPPIAEPEPMLPPDVAPEPPVEEPEPPVVATEDSTPEEREAIAETLIEAAQGEPVTAEAIQAAGLTYEDLPPKTPVEVRTDEDGNEVVITAEVAAALIVLESPAELLNAIFTDPGQVLLAFASIGADMSDEERTESEKIIVASVIAGQAAVTAAGAAAAYRRKP
jgi:hypothetical protein